MQPRNHFFILVIIIVVAAFVLLPFSNEAQTQYKNDSLLSALKTATHDSNKVIALRLLSENCKAEDTAGALSYANRSLELAGKTAYTRGEGNAYMRIAAIYRNSDFSKALMLYKKSLESFEKINYAKGKLRVFNQLAEAYRRDGVYDEAFAYFEKLLMLAQEVKDTSSMLSATGGKADIYRYKGDYVKSLEHYIKAIRLAREARNLKSEFAWCNNMAIIYGYENNTREEMKLRERVLEIAEETKDSMEMVLALNNLGNMHYDQKNKERALELYHKSLRIVDKIGVERASYKYVSQAYENLGAVAFDEQNYVKAREYYQLSLDLMLKSKLNKGILNCYGSMARVAVALKSWKEAEVWLMKMLELAKQIEYSRGEMEACEMLAQVMFEKGDYRKAYEYQSKFSMINQALMSETSAEKLAEMQTRFDTENKEKEIQLQNIEISQKDREAKQRSIIMYSFIGASAVFLILAFFSMRQYLQKKKVAVLLQEKNEEMNAMNNQILFQKGALEQKNKDITDSILYARTIQHAVLVPVEVIQKRLNDFFILSKPKDIVSGDFYFYKEAKNGFFVAVADCTGHGVPAGFMSMLGDAFLNEIVNGREDISPAAALDQLREMIIKSLQQNNSESTNKDGMDIALLYFENNSAFVQYAGANISLNMIRNGELKEIKADMFPIGVHFFEERVPFKNNRLALEKGDLLYIFSDGYADQFGEANGRKFMKKRMHELLLSVRNHKMADQEKLLNQAFHDWKGSHEQIDDVLVVGIRI